jgi:hypothetical protein
MLGHGQVQGFGEKYGMEFRRAMLDENADPWLVERHEREVFPLFHRRAWFAESENFLLYDVVTESGKVDDGVLAYSNGRGAERSLVLYQTRFGSARGRIRESAAYARKTASGAKRLVRRTLAEGLGLPHDPNAFVVFREARTGLEYIRSCGEIWERGLPVTLDAYGTHVFWEFREVWDGAAGQWSRLASRLAGAGVRSLEEALREVQLEPVHAPLRALFEAPAIRDLLDDRPVTDAGHVDLAARMAAFYASIAEATALTISADAVVELAGVMADRAEVGLGPEPTLDRGDAAALLAWLMIEPIGAMAPGDPAATTRAWFDELRLAAPLAGGLRKVDLDEGQAWAASDLFRVLLHLPRPSDVRGTAGQRDAKLLERWLADDSIRTAIGVNTWEGVQYFDRDRFAAMLAWAARLDALSGRVKPDAGFVARLMAAAEAAGYRVDRLAETLAAPAPAAAKPAAARGTPAKPRPAASKKAAPPAKPKRRPKA